MMTNTAAASISVGMIGEVLETLISSDFLTAEDIVAVLQVHELSDAYQHLRERYCSIHGTKLDRTYEDFMETFQHHYQPRDRNSSSSSSNSGTASNNDNSAGSGNGSSSATITDDHNIRFLIWGLQQQHFLSTVPKQNDDNEDEDEDDEDDASPPLSLCPDCLDCRMARFHEKKKCQSCNKFEDYRDIYTCGGPDCRTKTACSTCHHGSGHRCTAHGDDCPDQKNKYCLDCFDGYYCIGCDSSYHTKCMPPSATCHVCDEGICKDCVDCVDDGNENFTCHECSNTFHCDCNEDYHHCKNCEEMFCDDCKDWFWCENCDEACCRDCDDRGGWPCRLCDTSYCSDCDKVWFCEGCEDFYCDDCRLVLYCTDCETPYCERCRDVTPCSICDEVYCDDCKFVGFCDTCKEPFCQECRDVDFCDQCKMPYCKECDDLMHCPLCQRNFCINCKDAGGFRHGIICNDCEQKFNLEVKKKKNESCANCFLSEDCMDGVRLKNCSTCKAVKYCSRACQKQDWPSHRDVCVAAVKAATVVESSSTETS